jgi:hypothetical protein
MMITLGEKTEIGKIFAVVDSKFIDSIGNAFRDVELKVHLENGETVRVSFGDKDLEKMNMLFGRG